jgi:hypothetical protein
MKKLILIALAVFSLSSCTEEDLAVLAATDCGKVNSVWSNYDGSYTVTLSNSEYYYTVYRQYRVGDYECITTDN